MEHNADIKDTFGSSQNRKVVTDVVEKWRQAASLDGVSSLREVDTRGALLDVGVMAGTGFAFPGVSGRTVPRFQDCLEHTQDNRKSPFNKASDTE